MDFSLPVARHFVQFRAAWLCHCHHNHAQQYSWSLGAPIALFEELMLLSPSTMWSGMWSCTAPARLHRMTSLICSRCGHAGLFILGYCFYYYFARSEMSGFMQTAFYFGYMSMVSPRV